MATLNPAPSPMRTFSFLTTTSSNGIPLVSFLHGLCLDPGNIAPGSGFSDPIGAHQGLVYQSTQIFRLLFVVSSNHDWHGAKSVSLNSRHNSSAAIGHLLGDQAAVHSTEAHAS